MYESKLQLRLRAAAESLRSRRKFNRDDMANTIMAAHRRISAWDYCEVQRRKVWIVIGKHFNMTRQAIHVFGEDSIAQAFAAASVSKLIEDSNVGNAVPTAHSLFWEDALETLGKVRGDRSSFDVKIIERWIIYETEESVRRYQNKPWEPSIDPEIDIDLLLGALIADQKDIRTIPHGYVAMLEACQKEISDLRDKLHRYETA